MERRHRALVVLLAAVTAVALAQGARAQSAEQQLAERYAPVVRLVQQQEPCGHGEPYEPIAVDLLFGNESIALRGPWEGANVVRVGPTAADLVGRYEYNLDLPGDPLKPDCDYEQWANRLTGAPPTTYARVVTEPGKPGLALQYWFFYVFNDFNNKHEGDWEMIQLVFDASSAAEALSAGPDRVGYSQHEGAEAADWGGDKLELVEGTHPVVYPAAGSHANYYEPALFLGRSAAQGVGCDDTVGPSREIRPQVALVAAGREQYERAYPWLAYEGRWGEKQPAFFDGPTGPNTKRQWTEPISWAEEKFRDRSYAVPAGGVLGSDATDFFCDAVAGGSRLLTKAVSEPLPVLSFLFVVVVLALWGISRTSWKPSAPLHVGRRRAWGQVLTSSLRMYRRHWRLFGLIGLGFIPVGVVVGVSQVALFGVTEIGFGTQAEAGSVATGLGLALGLLATLAALMLLHAVTARAMADLDAGRPVGFLPTFRKALRSFGALLGALAVAAVAIFVLELVVIGVPIAIWLLVRWSLTAQVVELEGESSVGALRRSAALVKGHWLRVASITVMTSIALLLGPFLGALLILVTSTSFALVNVVAGLVYAAVLPLVAIATTYVYFDLRVREQLTRHEDPRRDVLPAELV